MTILGIDSSDDFLSVGLFSESDGVLSITSEQDVKKTILHSYIADILHQKNIGLDSIDGVAVAIGPGSFTGLRVGLAAAKGICWTLGIPLAGVSSIEALAACVEEDAEKFMVVKDAKKKEFYYGGFSRADGNLQRISPDSIGPANALEAFVDDRFVFTGPGLSTLKKDDSFNRGISEISFDKNAPGGQVARLGLNKIKSGNTIDPVSSAPQYIRTPEFVKAEI